MTFLLTLYDAIRIGVRNDFETPRPSGFSCWPGTVSGAGMFKNDLCAAGGLNMHPAPLQSGESPEYAKLLKEALVYLQRREPNMATHVLKRALEVKPRDPLCMSYLGLCMTMVNRNSREALALCEGALKIGCYDAVFYCNLGKVHLLRGSRRNAYAAFRSGLKVDPRNRDIRQELHAMGVRRHAVFAFLPRRHFANRIGGRIWYMLRRLFG